MNKKSIWAVVAGLLAIIVVTTLVDIALHAIGVFPPMEQPINDTQALLATAYRVVISIGGAWLTAWLAPDKPMKHVIILGCVGVVLGLLGVMATWNLGLGPGGIPSRWWCWRCRSAGWVAGFICFSLVTKVDTGSANLQLEKIHALCDFLLSSRR